MNNLTRPLLFLFFLSLNHSAFALVDYSEAAPENRMSSKVSQRIDQQTSRNESKLLIWKSDLSFTTNYEAMEIGTEKLGVLNLNTHIQTPANIYFDISYWTTKYKKNSQNGNPKIILGFNWLRFGNPGDEARLDLYGGAKLSSSSLLASSRTDKIFGVETTKRFGSFGLGISYDMSLVGTPKNNLDMHIGNINRIGISGGWMVSNDIQFELEVENFKINQASNTTGPNYLIRSISFSTLSPKLNLTVAPAVNLELGARFRTNKPKTEQDLASAKLFDLHGAYSNSLFAGLNLNI